jgi:hypothetical protein
MDRPVREGIMDPGELGRLVGEWTMTAGPPGGPAWPGEARVRFDWLDGAFLLERWRIDAPTTTIAASSASTGWGCAAASGRLSARVGRSRSASAPPSGRTVGRSPGGGR